MVDSARGEGKPLEAIPVEPQPVGAPLSRSAVFLTLTVAPGPDALKQVGSTLDELDDLLKTVGFRDSSANLTCVVGLGSELWDRIGLDKRPKELRPFEVVKGDKHTAIATPGDLFFHIRAGREDLTFEFERLLMKELGDSVSVEDEVIGFQYFDARDVLGFVDGTANPTGPDVAVATLIGDEDADFKGGSYVVVQKYLHAMDEWEETSVDEQEEIIGRTIVSNVELPDAETGQKSHKTLTTILDEDGEEIDIVRANMPFGRPGDGEYGTYFIGYSRFLWVVQEMLEHMFIGDPPGLYDRLLDFSTPATGCVFFVPPSNVMQELTAKMMD